MSTPPAEVASLQCRAFAECLFDLSRELRGSFFLHFSAARQLWFAPFPQVRISDLATNCPRQICCLAIDDDGAVGLEHGAGPGDGLVGAAEPGGCVGGGDHGKVSSRGLVLGGGLEYRGPRPHRGYVPLLWRFAVVEPCVSALAEFARHARWRSRPRRRPGRPNRRLSDQEGTARASVFNADRLPRRRRNQTDRHQASRHDRRATSRCSATSCRRL